MIIWKKIKKELESGHELMLMIVIESQGSSPGRIGFKMMVSQSGKLSGSIGGGMMEYKLVELCKQELLKKTPAIFIKKQIHQTNIPKNKSGMICSGEQTIAFYPLDKNSLDLIEHILQTFTNKLSTIIEANSAGININKDKSLSQKYNSRISDDKKWNYQEALNFKNKLIIIGGGHVSLALSKWASELDFDVHVFDTRPRLNTMNQYDKVTYHLLPHFNQIVNYISENNNQYIAILSTAYQTDKIILKQLVHLDFNYLGLMGSQTKVNKLFRELEDKGVSQENLTRVHAPIGLAINSQTPDEIAVSILGEMIRVRNF